MSLKIGLFFELNKNNFKWLYKSGLTEIFRVSKPPKSIQDFPAEDSSQELYAECVYLDLLEPIEVQIDLLITRGQVFYEKRLKHPEYDTSYRNLENYCQRPENCGPGEIRVLGGPPSFFQCLERTRFYDFEQMWQQELEQNREKRAEYQSDEFTIRFLPCLVI